MRFCVFDIETAGLNKFEHRISCICWQFVEVSVLGEFSEVSPVLASSGLSEKTILENFAVSCAEFAPSVFVGFNLERFDWPFLVFRSLLHGVRVPLSYGGWSWELVDLRALLHGRLHVYDALEKGSLDFFAARLGVPHDSSLSGLACVEALARADFLFIERHCRDDVCSSVGLFRKLVELGVV